MEGELREMLLVCRSGLVSWPRMAEGEEGEVATSLLGTRNVAESVTCGLFTVD